STLMDEYDVLARETQIDRWATLLDIAPFAEDVADDVFTSPYYERLEAALARHEAAGHLAAVALNALAPRLTPGHEQIDPASQLAPGKNRRPRVAGLIATPAEPITGDMQTALVTRQTLIEAAARRLVQEAQDAGTAWLSRLGTPTAQPRARTRWENEAAAVALYRHRYDISDPAPLGDAKTIRNPEQAAEHRAAQVALARLRRLTEPANGALQSRSVPHVSRHRLL